MFKIGAMAFILVFTSFGAAARETIAIEMYSVTVEGTGAKIGIITARDTPEGVEFVPELSGLTSGAHGFHLHQEPNCNPAEKDGNSVPGLAAKGHFDPENTEIHAGPGGTGHLGDLPALTADRDGNVSLPVLAPRLKTGDLKDHALVIHAGGDNYADVPSKLGGGGARVACGIIR